METLIQFKNFVAEITASNSKKFKQEVLQKYKDDEVIQKYLKIAFDPYTVYGISTKKLHKEVKVGDTWCAPTVFDLFEYLEDHNTGRDQDVAVCQLAIDWLVADDPEAAAILEKLICKDLSIGVDAKSINAVMPDLIPTFNVQLAQKYFEKPEKLEGKKFAITTKIDGGRIIAIKENGQVSFYTRAGQRYEGLVDLEREMQLYMEDNTVLDGEITLLDPKGLSSKEQYKETMKITRKDGEKHGIKMIVFDYMSAAEFKTQQSAFTYLQRRMMIDHFFPFDKVKFFEVLPILYMGSDTSVIPTLLDQAIANGEEGIMINDCEAFYEFGRTWNLMKVKKMNTLDLEIVGFEEGSGRLAGTLGAILVRYKNGNLVKVGSGFSDELRSTIWENQATTCGAICEIQYFEETTNADGGISLRFPVFKDFRPDKLQPDF
jgi:DNA ligase-1